MAATPKLGAKNQLACPNGYTKNTDTKIEIGPENAIALYGRIPTKRAISNWRKQKPISPNAPCNATKVQIPPI
jgi:hypothetical protein